MIKDQLKNFTYSLYHIRTMPHESISIIGWIANPPGMELCAKLINDPGLLFGSEEYIKF